MSSTVSDPAPRTSRPRFRLGVLGPLIALALLVLLGALLNGNFLSYGNITNTDSIPSYVIANAEISYDADNWGASVDVRNITNKRYFIAANGGGALVGDPLSAFLNIHVNY